MTDDRYERMSERLAREKSPEAKRAEMIQNLELCFNPRNRDHLPVTRSARDHERVRAYLPDEDAYAGWVENFSYTGIARIADEKAAKYVAEQHFPNQQGKPTYLWEFTPTTSELYLVRREADEITQELEIPIAADPEQQRYFLQLTRDMAVAHKPYDYERQRLLGSKYTFELEDLQ